jgi:chromosome segregation ATPase
VIEPRALATAVCCLIAIFQGRAATLDDLERQILGVVAQRQAAEGERARLVSEAAKLADAIGLAQSRSGSASRASAPLERQLRDFDRLAARLDAVDRTLRDYNSAIARLRKAVAVELDQQAKRAREADPLKFAALATQLEITRRRIDEITGPPREFRPLLIVRPSATDTAADLDQKLAVLDAEQIRGTEALVALDQDVTVMGGRIVVVRQLLTDLEAAARGAPPDLRLIQRQVEEVQSRLRDLDVSRRDLLRVRETLVQELAEVRRQIAECRVLRGA